MQVGAGLNPRDIVTAAMKKDNSAVMNTLNAAAMNSNGGVPATTGGDTKVASGPNVTPNIDPGVQNAQSNFNSMVNAGGIQRTQTGNIGAGRGGNGALIAFGKKDDNKTTGLNNGSLPLGSSEALDGEDAGPDGIPHPLFRKTDQGFNAYC